MPFLFGRKLRLIVAGKDGEGIDLGRLSCRFEVTRDFDAANARAKITIFNLSQDTTARIQAKYTRLRLDAGYEQRMGMIFDGDVNNVTAEKDGADRIVEIYAYSGLASKDRAFTNLSVPSGTDVRSLLAAVADSMGLPISEMSIRSQPIVGNRVIAGQSFFEMNKLAKDYSFRWMVDNSQIRIQEVPRQPSGAAIVVSRETGMINTPILDQRGVQFTTLLDPRLNPGVIVEVRSAAPKLVTDDTTLFRVRNAPFPKLEGAHFDVTRLLHIGHTRGQPWYSQAYAFLEGASRE